jgi:hypothetical protein
LIAAQTFAIASGDELWIRGRLAESRLMHGQARQTGDTIDASDARDEGLVRDCQVAIDAARTAVASLRDARVRLVARATREDGVDAIETTITISIDGMAVVTTPDNAIDDYELLQSSLRSNRKPAADASALPIVWRNGSAAVLLHEAIGHAAEHGAPAVAWPSWLTIEAPLTPRRSTFRNVPLPRMTRLIARQTDAPFAMPEERIEVQLIAGGAYDPLTDIVTINVAASTAGPFTIRCTRTEVAASIRGAQGRPIRYPGVICSREGQELYVASHAPLMITDPLP